jgi:adenosine deaminase
VSSGRPPAVTDRDASLLAFLERAPKAEVHVHLEGAVSAAALEAGAARRGGAAADAVRSGLDQRLGFASFEGFIALFRWLLAEHFRTPEDYVSALLDVAGTFAAANVRYAELSVSAGALLFFERPLGEILDALTSAADAVQAAGGPELRFVADGVQKHGPDPLARVVELVAPLPRARWPALGLAGALGSGRVAAFAEVFAEARRRGLAADVHAGEAAGPESVREALEDLGADRIIHGVAAAGDPGLLQELRTRRVPVALNPTSNVRTGAVASLAAFPLRAFLRAGVVVSINTDDPALFGTTLAGELLAVARTFRLGQSSLEQLVLGGLECALLPERRRAALLERWGSELERLRSELGLDARLSGEPPRVYAPE